MIISHKYKFIFIHIPKCAGTSITRSLIPLLGEHDLVLGCTPVAEKAHNENLKNGGPTKHWDAQKIMGYVGMEIWSRYFKFCFVRNPWDLMVSLYHFSIMSERDNEKHNIKKIKQLEDFEDYILSPLSSRKNCIDFITDNKGNIIVDYVGKFELINWDLSRIFKLIGLPVRHVARVNASNHSNYINYYNPLTREIVRDRYKNDIQRFNYVFHKNKRQYIVNKEKNIHPKKEWLIIHGAHHKAATSWFSIILRRISECFNWKYEQGDQQFPDTDVDIYLNYLSNFDFSSLGPYVGTHLIRDPRDMVVSGYYYHLWCDEIWCRQPVDDFDGKSYQEVLNSLNLEDGIMFEMSNIHGSFKRAATFMLNWNYDNPYILELKYEEITNYIEQQFLRIFNHYGFNSIETDIAMNIIDRYKFEKLTDLHKGKENHKSHFRKGIPGDWKNHYNKSHKKAFKELYPGLLEKLRYEQNDLW